MAAVTTVGTDLHAVHLCPPGVEHRLHVVGYLLGPRPAGLDCDSPLRVVCRNCDHRTVWRCSGHRESRCGPCAARYRRRVRAVAQSGLALAQRSSSGFLYMLTLTAPGTRAHRLPDGSPCPCTPAGGVHLAAWNASHSRRWNHFRTVLRQGVPEVQFFRGVEVQNRGALHDHALVWSPVALSTVRLRDLALRAGFGHAVDLAPIEPGSRKCAYYVSKYVTKATDSRDLVPWLAEVVDTRTGEVSQGVVAGRYRTWSMSREWGSTMAQVRAASAAYARLKASEADALSLAQALDTVAALLGALPCSEPPAGGAAAPPG